MNKNENSNRIQTSLLNPFEKKVLIWLAKRMPSWVTSDMLTWFSLFAAVLIAAGYLLTNYAHEWLWLCSFGVVLHWFGDSLDGTLARFRNQSRPLYGFYIDHNMDCVAQFFIIGGMGLSAYMHLWSALLILAAYLALEVYVMICAHLKNEFKLTYGFMGPTEFRVFMIMINTVWYFMEPLHDFCLLVEVGPLKSELLSMDVGGMVVALILFSIYINSLVKDGKFFANIDPLKKK